LVTALVVMTSSYFLILDFLGLGVVGFLFVLLGGAPIWRCPKVCPGRNWRIWCEDFLPMKAVRLIEVGKPLRLEKLPAPQIGPEEVLVRVQAAGICHSDAHYRAGVSKPARCP
jgi:hypothetical protein